MWEPVKADAQVLMADGANEAHAWRVAMNDGLRDQNQYVAVPRRLAEIILDIWNIHFRLIKRNPRMVKACLNNRRFRAAYDFLLLRGMVHEVDDEISEWWTDIQELEPNDREAMISDLNDTYKQSRQPRQQSNEPNGNSVDYNSVGNDDNFGNTVVGDGYEGGFSKPGAAPKGRRQNKGGQRGQKKGATGGQHKTTGRGRRSNNPNQGNDAQNANNNPGNGDQPNKARRGKAGKKRSSKKRTNNGDQRRSRSNSNRQNSRARNASEPRFQEARPADEFGVTSSASKKKVKVRHKRKIAGPTDNDDKPLLG
jgi:poly(A) polymerase